MMVGDNLEKITHYAYHMCMKHAFTLCNYFSVKDVQRGTGRRRRNMRFSEYSRKIVTFNSNRKFFWLLYSMTRKPRSMTRCFCVRSSSQEFTDIEKCFLLRGDVGSNDLFKLTYHIYLTNDAIINTMESQTHYGHIAIFTGRVCRR